MIEPNCDEMAQAIKAYREALKTLSGKLDEAQENVAYEHEQYLKERQENERLKAKIAEYERLFRSRCDAN